MEAQPNRIGNFTANAIAPNAPERSSSGRHLATSEDLRPTTVLSMPILQIPQAVVYAISGRSSV
jgi:hypothetical protein